ncbi:MAG TPA: response regulator transcription factor [Candidatus Limnocylindrales bacterium]|jgi:DNA-binding NarL/FixJ family response regulator|nr:response regulator transcription factor [Candidatus Limnocylindrales bacterium]
MPGNIKVFIVDDHPVFRHGLKQVIQADPQFEVVGEAGDDVTALPEITRTRPAVIIADVRLPQSSGLELVKIIRGKPQAPACLVLTMNREEATFNAAMDAGASGYLLKEDALELVLQGLKAVAAGSVYLSPAISGWHLRRHQRASALKQQKTGLASLTATERRILQLVAENRTNKEIAGQLFVSHRTVETHRSNICQKLELQGVHKLLQFAIEHRSEL